LEETGKLLIILDGYDELAEQYKGKNLYYACGPSSWRAKVIITCRSEALVAYTQQEKESLFQPYKSIEEPYPQGFQEAYVQAFRAEQIAAYVKQYTVVKQEQNQSSVVSVKILSGEDYLETLNKLPGVKELIQNPFMLQVVLDVLPALWQRYEDKKQLER